MNNEGQILGLTQLLAESFGTDELAVYTGVVQDFNGVTPGPASQLSYNVWVNFPGRPMRVEGLVPASERWPDTLNVDAIEPGSFVLIGSVKGRLQLVGRELPHFAPCTPGLRNPGGLSRLTLNDITAAYLGATDKDRAMFRKAVGIG